MSEDPTVLAKRAAKGDAEIYSLMMKYLQGNEYIRVAAKKTLEKRKQENLNESVSRRQLLAGI